MSVSLAKLTYYQSCQQREKQGPIREKQEKNERIIRENKGWTKGGKEDDV